MVYKPSMRISENAVTPKEIFLNRRSILMGAGLAAGSALLPRPAWAALETTPWARQPTDLKPTPKSYATSYNNFYEFGTGKEDPAAKAGGLTISPWTVRIDGMVDKPGDYAYEDIVPKVVEERIYRFRCVEAWSMVVPWNGFELKTLLERVGVQASAKYVAFETLVRPSEMPGQAGFFQALEWPYREGLRLDEAVHPLTLLVNGMYGEELPRQNGAPLRLIVPWKYGFKSIKSIVRITLTDKQPPTSWNMSAPGEYGFYSNVNPTVNHPRWSQAEERVLGGGLFAGSVPTLMFNGYEEDVASLYAGMDLKANY